MLQFNGIQNILYMIKFYKELQIKARQQNKNKSKINYI